MKSTNSYIQYGEDHYNDYDQLFLNDHEKALSKLYDHYYKNLMRYGLKVLPDSEIVEDAIQELFLYLWEHKRCIENVNSIESYLLLSLRHRIYRQIKTQKAIHQRNRIYIDDCMPGHSESSGNFEQEKEALFRESIKVLSDRQQQIIHLKFFEGLSTSEIATFLGIKRQSVYNCISTALSRLNNHIASQLC